MIPEIRNQASGVSPRRLFAFNGGMFRGRVSRILELAGWQPKFGLPGRNDLVAVWGGSPIAYRGRYIAARRGSGLVHVEDAFLRSILPGRASGPVAKRGPIGLIADPVGLHFDPRSPSLLEKLITSGETAPLHTMASRGIKRLIAADLSKYNAHLPALAPPEPG